MEPSIDHLLARYFSGEASVNDIDALEHWLSLSEKNEVYFEQTSRLFELMGLPDASLCPKPHTQKSKTDFLAYMRTNGQEKRVSFLPSLSKRRTLLPRYILAACVTLFIIISFAIWNINTPKKVILTGSSNSKQYELPDKTQITLTDNSQIQYNTHYGKGERQIELNGKAKFVVGNQAEGSLMVHAGETIIKDIGTVFSVTAYPDSNWVSIEVEEGEVHFYTKENKGIQLTAGESGIYIRSNKTFQKSRKTNTGNAFNEPEEGNISTFEDSPLQDVIDQLNLQYPLHIRLSNASLAKQRISISIHSSEDVDFVLQVIANTLDLHVSKQNGQYILSK